MYNTNHIETETSNTTVSIISASDNANIIATFQATFDNPAFKTVEKRKSIAPLDRLNTLILPSGLVCIEREAFEGMSCQAVIIPEGCQTIEALAFANCLKLLYVRIPKSVIYIDETAFSKDHPIIIDFR